MAVLSEIQEQKEDAMHKKTTQFALVAAGLTIALTLTGCTQKNDSANSSANPTEKMVTVAFVPKLQGIPYFEAMNTGGQKAEKEMGNFKWLYQGPTEADAAAQAQIVRAFIQQGVTSLMVAPNDPNSMGPVLQEATKKGIKVATSDTDAPNSVREFFVSQASTEGLATTLTDTLMTAMGGKGKYAIVSCGETAENLNSWIAAQKKYTKSKYPNAEIVDVVFAGENQAKAVELATNLLNAHPDLTGLVGECTPSAPAVAEAVRAANKIGKVFTVGIGTPQAMKPYLKDGSSSGAVLWDVEQFGYLTAWAGAQLALGKSFEATNRVSDALPAVTYDETTKTLLLGPPLVITSENVDKFNY